MWLTWHLLAEKGGGGDDPDQHNREVKTINNQAAGSRKSGCLDGGWSTPLYVINLTIDP
jgi:hypothetical protein